MRDVEGLCVQVIHRSALKLSYHEREDLLAYLLALTWELSERFQPGGISFCSYATTTLRLRVIDWQRSRNGRTVWKFAGHTYERPRPKLVSLDADDPNGNRLVETLGGSSLDGDASGFAADVRDLAARGRRPRRRDDWMGDEAA